MMKVEAVIVRDRVETVMEAVEEHTGHVGVTVIEAVGHGREADLLLLPHRFADRAVLDLLQLRGAQHALLPLLARIGELGRAQQAADLVGAIRGFHGAHHK